MAINECFRYAVLLTVSAYPVCFPTKLIYFPDKHSLNNSKNSLNNSIWALPSMDNYLGLMSKSTNTASKGTIIVFHGNAGSAITGSIICKHWKSWVTVWSWQNIRLWRQKRLAIRNDPDSNGVDTLKQALHDLVILFFSGRITRKWCNRRHYADTQTQVKGLSWSRHLIPGQRAQHHYWFFLAKWLIRDDSTTLKICRITREA